MIEAHRIVGRFSLGAALLMAALASLSISFMFAAPGALGAAPNGELDEPWDVEVDGSGNVYVADTDNARIQKFTSNGAYLDQWGSAGSGNGEFYSAKGIAVDPAGNVYVADAGENQRIQKFSPSGIFLTAWGGGGSGNGQFSAPEGIDVADSVYVADAGLPASANDRIQKFTLTGSFVSKWGTTGSGNGQFRFPKDVAVGPDGSVYVIGGGDHAENNDRVQKFTSSGTFLTKWGSTGSANGQFSIAEGLAVASDGTVYVADTNNNRIQKFTSSGTFLASWGGSGSGEGQFEAPKGIAVDDGGNVYVADSYNNRIQKLTSSGIFLRAWGDEDPSGPSDSGDADGSPKPNNRGGTQGVAKPSITFSPRGRTSRRRAAIRFHSNHPGGLLQCRLTGKLVPRSFRRWGRCASPKRYTSLGLGGKVFWLREFDGGEYSEPVRRRWVVVKRPIYAVTNSRVALMRVRCSRNRQPCTARVIISAGKTILAKGRYRLAPRGRGVVRLKLTRAGRQKIRRVNRARARVTFVDVRTKKRKTLPVVMRRRTEES